MIRTRAILLILYILSNVGPAPFQLNPAAKADFVFMLDALDQAVVAVENLEQVAKGNCLGEGRRMV